eukprot:CAMPEP_0177546370 /NCGR_PEP_ID=MMETSP0369-20130122/63185_1 /TAXON_ID=447022 ORGANISM="Scrippsiella hangoei-like, Strain SHHI-4" /NCGR_SAMPLE_ID=MMETSP0369 /ASSEMBLY_ACC=CAM_ASM_000364 /LENGTH=93 /DNA_ID=CAMNT_0019030865 /DNA_START=124 /DNA_END=403 /DNA_ORIENTATION=+
MTWLIVKAQRLKRSSLTSLKRGRNSAAPSSRRAAAIHGTTDVHHKLDAGMLSEGRHEQSQVIDINASGREPGEGGERGVLAGGLTENRSCGME